MNSANSGKLINQWSINWAQFKDPVSHMCLAGAVVACWPLAQEVAGWQGFECFYWMTYFCHQIHWIQWKHLGKTQIASLAWWLLSRSVLKHVHSWVFSPSRFLFFRDLWVNYPDVKKILWAKILTFFLKWHFHNPPSPVGRAFVCGTILISSPTKACL